MGGGYRPTGSRAVCLGARGQDRRGVLGRTAGPSMRGDGGRGRPLVAPLDSVSFIGVSETFSDRGTRRPPLWLALSRVRSGPALPRAAWHALAGRLGCPGGAWSMPPAESLDGHHGPAAGPVGSSLRVLGGGGPLEGGQEGCALEGEGLGRGGAAALLQSLPPLPPAGGPAAPPWPLAPRWLSECPQGRRGEGSGPGRATVALLCRREQVGPWNLSCQV